MRLFLVIEYTGELFYENKDRYCFVPITPENIPWIGTEQHLWGTLAKYL